MKLSFDEKLLLALYLEFFNEEYEINNQNLTNHTKMQNLCYLLQILDINDFDFGFVWSHHGPHSPAFEILLNKIDNKDNQIEGFYEFYNDERNKSYINYKDQLQYLLRDYLSSSQIEKVNFACYLLQDILKEYKGSELLTSVIFLTKSVLINDNLSLVIKELEKCRFDIDYDLIQKIWKDITLLGIIEMKKENYFNNKILKK